MIPNNTVQQDGIGEVTADDYNTYLQGVSFANGLANFVGVDGMIVYIPGLATYGDNGQGEFYWNAGGTANDGTNNIQPNGVSVGCWTRLPAIPASSTGPTNFTNAVNFASGGSIASAATTAIGAATGNNVTITGTTTITAFDTVQAGTWREVTFAGILTLTYNATSLIMPTAANVVTAAGDTSGWLSLGGGNWICMWYQRASGQQLGTISGAQLAGTTTNDSANAGNVGQYISSTVSSGSAVSLTNNTAATVTSISIPAGDWDVWASVALAVGSGATPTSFVGSVSAVNNVGGSDTGGAYFQESNAGYVAGQILVRPTGVTRVSLASTTTYYLIAFSGFSGGTVGGYGSIFARRVR